MIRTKHLGSSKEKSLGLHDYNVKLSSVDELKTKI